jgi:hypothetical protein
MEPLPTQSIEPCRYEAPNRSFGTLVLIGRRQVSTGDRCHVPSFTYLKTSYPGTLFVMHCELAHPHATRSGVRAIVE